MCTSKTSLGSHLGGLHYSQTSQQIAVAVDTVVSSPKISSGVCDDMFQLMDYARTHARGLRPRPRQYLEVMTIDLCSYWPFFCHVEAIIMASTSGPPPKVRKTDSAESRRFLSSWKSEFPWLIMDSERNAMYCSYCIDAKKNFFTTGCNKFKKDSLKKHATTADHRFALEARSARRDMQHAIAHVNRSQEKAVVAALKTVYFMAKKNLANDIFGDMKQFLILQVSTKLK